MRKILILLIFLTFISACTTTVQTVEPLTAEQQIEMEDQKRKDRYILTILATIPLFIIAL